MGSQILPQNVKNNKDVRELLKKSNILPENLPKEEDVKSVERKIKNKEKKIIK
jgi:DNA-damage-inducible protein D